MIRYHKNTEVSKTAAELFADAPRGLTSVAAAMPGLSVAGGFFCHRDKPLAVIPAYFLLDEQERSVVDPMFPDRFGTYFVAGTLGEAKTGAALAKKVTETGKTLESEGFLVEQMAPELRLVV